MRIFAIVAALALCGCGFAVSDPALAEQSPPNYQPGGLQHTAGWCKAVSSSYFDSQVYGFYKPCPETASAHAARTSMAYMPRRYSRR